MKITKTISNLFSKNVNKNPGGLKNESSECYMNAMIQALASSELLIKKLQILSTEYSQSIILKSFLNLIIAINDSQEATKNTTLLKELITQIRWDKSLEQDAFHWLSATISSIEEELKHFQSSNVGIPIKFQVVHRFHGINIPDKLQSHLGLSLGISKNYIYNLKSLILNYFESSLIDDDPQKSIQMLFYKNIPETLIIHIQANKWDIEQQKMIKPEYNITYEEYLPIPLKIMSDLKDEDSIKCYFVNYKIKAIVQHIGTISNGHYVTYRTHKNKWYLTSDEQIQEINFINNICPYIMIYEIDELQTIDKLTEIPFEVSKQF